MIESQSQPQQASPTSQQTDQQPVPTTVPAEKPSGRQFLKDYQAPQFDIESIHLKFDLHETKTVVTSTLKFNQKDPNAVIQSLRLDGVGLKLKSIHVNGEVLQPGTTKGTYGLDSAGLTLLSPLKSFELKTVVEINPSENSACEGLYLSSGIFCTQCEAESFRKITYMLDRPDSMTSYEVEITADKTKYPVLLSNGDLIHTETLSDNRHKAVWRDPHRKPSYLFALVAGDLGSIHDTFTTKSGREVKLSVYASHGKQSRCHHALESLKKAMKWDEDRFGLEYDLGQYMIVSIDDFNMGAMENKGLNVFNSRLVLADRESATDSDFDSIEAVVGHEYFHNWTGNRVTCRNWFELSLKEGLTVFRDQEFSADLHSRSVQRIKDVDTLRIKQFAEDASPNAHPVRPESCLAVDNFYTSTIYEKGSELIRMLQTIVGRDGFRKGMDEYIKRHDGQAVTIIDFVKAISEPNQFNYEQFLLWYTQEGTPSVDVKTEYVETSKEFKLHVKQTPGRPGQKPLHIPLKFGLIDQHGKEVKLNSNIISLTEIEKTVSFSDIQTKPVLSINREFSAPIKMTSKVSNDDLAHLMKFDTDDFNRREAAVKLLTGEAIRLIELFESQAHPNAALGQDIVNAVEIVLKDQKIAPQFKALMLQIPSEQALAQEVKSFSSKAIRFARRSLYKGLVEAYPQLFLDLYDQHAKFDTSGDRAIKNVVLGYLCAAGNENAKNFVDRQYQAANNMTDKIMALLFACDFEIMPGTSEGGDVILKGKLLNSFKSSWAQDKVVVNKWFQVQAMSGASDTFEHICNLTKDPVFDSKNPNNVYSLIGAFGSNLSQFHQDRLDIYSWYMDRLSEVDQFNPQAAARIASAFQLLPKLKAETQIELRGLIKGVLSLGKLSKNTTEILEKL